MESLIDRIIDNYKILDLVGRGGMGVVYKALDISLEKIVALKMIDPVLAKDENFLKRFKTEARALAKLENPNIVTVYALRETEFGVFMVMEFIEAKTLADWLREYGPFTWRETVFITRQLLNAISHAHKVGVIHRDIKPSNIMLNSEYKVKVTDFGLAKVIRRKSEDSTFSEMRAGTLYYMSPEQVKGLKNVDFRSDIYSLGMTLYEMLAGRVPFEKTDSDFAIQKMIVEGQIISPLKFKSTIPKPLVKIVIKAIDKDPEKRFNNCDEMMQTILDFEKTFKEPEYPKSHLPATTFLKSILVALALLMIIALVFVVIRDPFKIFKSAEFVSSPKTPKMEPINLITPDSGIISITTDLVGASVRIDDKIIGSTPLNNLKLKTGSVSLQIEREGYSFIDTTLVVFKEQSKSYDFKLNRPLLASPAVVSTKVTINSSPAGALVLLNNKYIGITPREDEEVKPGNYSMVIRKTGYAEYQKSFFITRGQNLRFDPTLEAVGTLSVNTQPPGADVLLNGKNIGITPINQKELKVASYQILLREDGYQEYTERIEISENQPSTIFQTLILQTGTLKILVIPWGAIYIDDVLKIKEADFYFQIDLAVGSHKVKVDHPKLGVWEKVVKIVENSTREININFNSIFKLIITSEPDGCKIFIDDKFTGELTPKQFKLHTGKHKIYVHKDGYTLTKGVLEINLDEDLIEPINFQLNKKN